MSGPADVFVRLRIFWKNQEYVVDTCVVRSSQDSVLRMETEVLRAADIKVLHEALMYHGVRDPSTFLEDARAPVLWRVVVLFEDKAVWTYDRLNQRPLFDK